MFPFEYPIPEINDQNRAAIHEVFGNLHDHFQEDSTESDKGFVKNRMLNHQNVTIEDSSDLESIIILDDNEEKKHDELIIND